MVLFKASINFLLSISFIFCLILSLSRANLSNYIFLNALYHLFIFLSLSNNLSSLLSKSFFLLFHTTFISKYLIKFSTVFLAFSFFSLSVSSIIYYKSVIDSISSSLIFLFIKTNCRIFSCCSSFSFNKANKRRRFGTSNSWRRRSS